MCLSFIGCGGSLAAIFAESPVGVDLMIAGLATQVLFTAIFCFLLYLIQRRLGWPLNKSDDRWYIIGRIAFLPPGGEKAQTDISCRLGGCSGLFIW